MLCKICFGKLADIFTSETKTGVGGCYYFQLPKDLHDAIILYFVF